MSTAIKKGIKKSGNLNVEWMVAVFNALAALCYLYYAAQHSARSRSLFPPLGWRSWTLKGTVSLDKHVNCYHKLQIPLLWIIIITIIMPQINTKE